ncbi:tRNA-splicing endonuclease subunit [Bachmanniomyces sp. S44760]|nr:tRNA-splicing endonuclease subunit [Bachmanniomyces sp. S44760]
MASSSEGEVPDIPFPIFRISKKIERYLLYDIKTITWLRRTYHILGVLIGTLPQIPQQNVFLGLPLELMPEEARLLIELGVAHAVNDTMWHKNGLKTVKPDHLEAYRRGLEREGAIASREAEKQKLQRTEKALQKLKLDALSSGEQPMVLEPDDTESLFGTTPAARRSSTPATETQSLSPAPSWSITPTTSYPPLPVPPNNKPLELPQVKPSSYALFNHLHGLGYFISPGLRFGCQFLVYPGDPLRFHSHFLSVSADWDEEIDLLDLVGGGRLGTGVKKGWLIGGNEEVDSEDLRRDAEEDDTKSNRVRTFCIEWAGM